MQHLLPQLGGAGEIALPTTMDYLILAKGQLPPGFSILELPSWTLSWAHQTPAYSDQDTLFIQIPSPCDLTHWTGICMLSSPSRAEVFLLAPRFKNYRFWLKLSV